jgi:hypothetical protein
MSVPFVLQVIGLIALFLEAFSLAPQPRIKWGWVGLFLWLLSLMIAGVWLHPTLGVSH